MGHLVQATQTKRYNSIGTDHAEAVTEEYGVIGRSDELIIPKN